MHRFPLTELQALDQRSNTYPDEGVAVRVTELPGANLLLQEKPQLIPEGLEVTLPPAEGLLLTVSSGSRSKVAVTLLPNDLIVTVQEFPELELQPDHLFR